LAQAIQVGHGLPRRLAHATRGVVELTTHLLKLLADLGDDRLEAALEFVDGAGSVGLRLLAEFLDLRKRLLGLSGRVAAESSRDLFGARFGL